MKNSLIIIVFFSTTVYSQWFLQNTDVDRPFTKIFFVNADRGWALVNGSYMFASNGYLTITENGGTTWTNLIHSSEAYTDISFINENTGWITGNAAADYGLPRRYIRKTTNGGYNWSIQNVDSGYYKSLYSIYAIDNSNIWATGAVERIFRSTNSGLNWIVVQDSISNTYNYKIFFLNLNSGFTAGSNGKILKTTNTGVNWIIKYQGNKTLRDIHFINSNTGLVSGDNGILLKTTNAGDNWLSVNTGFSQNDIYSVYFLNELTGYIAGGIYYNGIGIVSKTTNGGNNWTVVDEGSSKWYGSVFFTNNNTGWIAGGWTEGNYGIGRIYKTATGGGIFIGIENINEIIPKSFSLHQNYPNPFNPTTKIKFDMPSNVKHETSKVKLIIYDAMGREVITLVNEQLKPGTYEVEFDGSAYASGVYFYSLITSEFIETKKLILLK